MYKSCPVVGGVEPQCVFNKETSTCIPFDPNNIEYRAYLKWLDGYTFTPEGWIQTSGPNTPEPADEVPA